MPAKERNDSLNQISEDKKCTVMIVSITAGSVGESSPAFSEFGPSLNAPVAGLNIIACSSVIFMEPWWNPYLEVSCLGDQGENSA